MSVQEAANAVAVDDDAEVIELWRPAQAREALHDLPTPPPWHAAAERRIAPADWLRFETYVAEIFTALGMEVDTPGTRETPRRFLEALYDATAGYDGDPKLATLFPTESVGAFEAAPSQIIEGPIPFHALCEHHALPFFGVAHVGYVADEQVIGISKLTRLVRLFARRFTIQERLGAQKRKPASAPVPAPHPLPPLVLHPPCTRYALDLLPPCFRFRSRSRAAPGDTRRSCCGSSEHVI